LLLDLARLSGRKDKLKGTNEVIVQEQKLGLGLDSESEFSVQIILFWQTFLIKL